MVHRFLLAVIALGLVVGRGASAQSDSDVTVTMEAQPSEVGVDEEVTVHVQVEGAPLAAVEIPDPPDATNLVLQDPTPQTESELSFDEGELTRRASIRWRYVPVEVGLGRIDPVTVRVREEDYTTAEIRVRVVSSDRGRSRTTPSRDGRVDPPAQLQGSRADGLEPRDILIRGSASADTAYENEQVRVEYRLFFRPGIRLRQSQMVDAWDAPGFWREELDVASRPTPRTTELFGEAYRAIVLKRVALFPTRTGDLQVDPLRIEAEARPGQRDARSPGGYERVTLSSEVLSVRARPLPADAPAAFDGAVGAFSLDSVIRADSVEVGDAVELTVRIHGTGNVATISPPVIEAPQDFDVYDPSVDTEIDRGGSVVRGTKTFTYTLVPRSNGRFTLSPIVFAYFDPQAEEYRTLRSETSMLRVTGDVPPPIEGRTGEGFPIDNLADPIEDNVRWVASDRSLLYAQPWSFAAVLVPISLAAGGAAYQWTEWRAGPVG